MSGELRVDIQGLDRAQRAVAVLVRELDKAEERAVTKGALAVEARTKERLSRTSEAQGDFLWTRSGALRASVAAQKAERDSQGTYARVGFRRGRVDRYAGVQEFGATITARSGAYLRFPIRRGGGLADANIVGWASKRSVTIPARAPLRTALAERRERIRDIVREEVNAAVARAASA